MKWFAYILIISMLSSTIIPCHAGEHEHGECSHHENHSSHHDQDSDSSHDEENDDHPCSPFCGFHSSVSNISPTPSIIAEDISFVEEVEKVFTYTPTYFYLQEFSIWNPPKA